MEKDDRTHGIKTRARKMHVRYLHFFDLCEEKEGEDEQVLNEEEQARVRLVKLLREVVRTTSSEEEKTINRMIFDPLPHSTMDAHLWKNVLQTLSSSSVAAVEDKHTYLEIVCDANTGDLVYSTENKWVVVCESWVHEPSGIVREKFVTIELPLPSCMHLRERQELPGVVNLWSGDGRSCLFVNRTSGRVFAIHYEDCVADDWYTLSFSASEFYKSVLRGWGRDSGKAIDMQGRSRAFL